MRRVFLSLFALLLSATMCFAQRGVQISEITFIDGDAIVQSIELTNFGPTTEDMSNWRFCSHDENQQRVYSGGIGGSIAPGDSMTLFSSSFTLATPFTPEEAYSLAIFDMDNGGFGGTANIVDHVQWSPEGVDSPGARFRSGQAVTGGVWTGATDWIPTSFDTSKIVMKEITRDRVRTGGTLHGPDDYEVVPNIPFGASCDLDGDSDCDKDDIDFLVAIGTNEDGIANWLTEASILNNVNLLPGDLDLNGAVDSTDLGLLLNNFGDMGIAGYSKGNTNGDENVDSTDLGRLLNNFGLGQSASSTAAVPEPGFGSAWLPIMLAIVVAWTRRKR